MGFLTGKKALITGLASNRSIAYGISEAFHREGAELAFTYQNDRLAERVQKMAAEFGSDRVFRCDVANDADIESLRQELTATWSTFDIIIHSIAFAPSDQIEGDFMENVHREGFMMAHDISAYSFVGLAKALYPIMNPNGAMLTLSYYGAEKAVPNYNVMGVAKASLEAAVRYMASSLGQKGIRVNAVSAGPIKTLAAAGIKDFRKIQAAYADVTPLRRNVTALEVGNTAAFLCSELASGITGEVVHVDAGYHAVAM